MNLISRFVVGYRKSILVAAVVVMVASGIFGGGVASSLSSGGFEDPDAESVAAAEVLAQEFGASPPDVILLVEASSGSVDDQAAIASAVELSEQLDTEPTVVQTSSYWSLGSPAALRNNTGDAALIFLSLEGDQGQVLERSATLAEKYRGTFGSLEVAVGGSGPLFAEVQETIEADLVRAESIAFPITLVLLVIIFGSLVAGLLPLGVGVFAILGTLTVLEVLTRFTEVSIFALNLTTALGLGLAIDYALFIVSRFREELDAGWEPGDAASRTVLTAGRTVVFSAATVAVSLAAMLVFPLAFLRSFGYAGIAVVALAAIGAVVVLPALLAVLGYRIERLRVRKVRSTPAGTGMWHRVATTVMKRPIPIATVVIAVLVVLGSPFLDVRLAQSDDRMLAPGSPARVVGDALRDDFGAFEAASIDVVAANAGQSEAAVLSLTLSGLDAVARVDGPDGSYIEGALVVPAGPASARFMSAEGFYLSVIPSVDPSSEAAESLVAEIRDLPAPIDFQVTGSTAGLADTKSALFASLPWALGIIGSVTFAVLFLMFGSLLVPIKAVVLNMLSLSATFGALVWIFQEGNLAEVLNFTPTGALDLTMPILMFCIAFGLSMDYEVFLLSRIKEEHDGGADNQTSVAMGLERTGRIVTAAALLISVVFVAFATSSVTVIKIFGLGMTLAVLVDAFLIRATLVPAFMRLAGEANWWAPGWLDRIYKRFGFSDSVELESRPPMIGVEPARNG